MRNGWVWLFLMFQASAVLAAPSAPKVARSTPVATAKINDEIRASLTREYEIEVTVQPHAGDAWSRLARRATGDAANWEQLATLNDAEETLRSEKPVRVPFRLLRPALQRQIVGTLFPSDRLTDDGWRHVIVGARGIEGESLWKIAEWFTGDGANYSLIRKANPGQGLSTHKGDVILVPRRLLAAAFGGRTEEENAPKTAEVRKPSDDQAQRAATGENVSETIAESIAVGAASLTYDRSAAEPFAVYRLQKGEALYSSVAIRFTGRVYSKDVGDVLDRIVKFNGIEDVARIPVGHPIRIPMELLLPEFLPQDDPTRVAREASRRESAKVAKRTRATGLAGVHVILDAGHGGRDVGTEHEDVWESVYVYDVACRLKELIENKSSAKAFMTTRSRANGFQVARQDVVGPVRDHAVQTTPRYLLDDAIVGVNLRWYLANSVLHRAVRSGAEKEKVIFISLHADSLHPSLRGAMAYIPAAELVAGSFRKSGEVYLSRQEVRERPVVRQSRGEAVLAEGLSRGLAESVIGSIQRSGLKVHPFSPVRDTIVRNGGAWVPAIIRYNMTPTRMLLELCNMGNKHDRELLQTKKYRQQVAEAIYAGIVDFYASQGDRRHSVVAAGAR